MFTAAAASGRKTRKGRTATVRPSTNLLISSAQKDSIAALRLQRLRLLGIIGARAELLAELAWGRGMSGSTPFTSHQDAALALLTSDARLSRKAGSFLGQSVVDSTPLTPAQREWMDTLLSKAGLPGLTEGEAS